VKHDTGCLLTQTVNRHAALAAAVGVIVIAVGGGGIKTMSTRWEAVATKYDEEKPRIAQAARNAPSLKDQAQQAKQSAQAQYDGGTPTRSGASRHS
jgi:hypothetical protein